MLTLTGNIKDLTVSPFDNSAMLALNVAEKSDIMSAYDELKAYDKLTIVLSKYRKRRSLNANAYMWVLCGKLADKLEITKDEVYKHYIREVGVFRPAEFSKDIAKTMLIAWQKLGLGWFAEELSETDGVVSVLLYYGSSTYNTAQMSRLIDSVIEDCKAQGIQTATPDEIENMKSLWKSEPI